MAATLLPAGSINNQTAQQRENDKKTTTVLTSGASAIGLSGSQLSLAFTNVSTATSATTGSASALPTDPAGYLLALIGTTVVKIPYYNV